MGRKIPTKCLLWWEIRQYHQRSWKWSFFLSYSFPLFFPHPFLSFQIITLTCTLFSFHNIHYVSISHSSYFHIPLLESPNLSHIYIFPSITSFPNRQANFLPPHPFPLLEPIFFHHILSYIWSLFSSITSFPTLGAYFLPSHPFPLISIFFHRILSLSTFTYFHPPHPFPLLESIFFHHYLSHWYIFSSITSFPTLGV